MPTWIPCLAAILATVVIFAVLRRLDRRDAERREKERAEFKRYEEKER